MLAIILFSVIPVYIGLQIVINVKVQKNNMVLSSHYFEKAI